MQQILLEMKITAITDVTGFGLAVIHLILPNHLSNLSIKDIPVLSEV